MSMRVVLRSLRRTPGFTATAVLTLALGIGLSVAVFTVAEALLLRRLPFRDQDRLVVLWGLGADRVFETPLGLTDARAFARRTRTLERTAFFEYEGTFPASIQDGDRITRMYQAVVSGEFFEVLGGRPLLGRALNAEDDRVGGAGGGVVGVGPPLPATLPTVTAIGTTVFLIQRLTYQFKPSVALLGRMALWRTTVVTGQTDELVAPFDTSARFRFFVVGSDTAQAAVPSPLSNVRGLELGLTSQSDRAPEGAAAPRQAQVVTAVFFNNQLK